MTAGPAAAAVLAAFGRREEPVAALGRSAPQWALACRDLARRLQAGGRLLVFGSGPCATDAQHVAVEFVHPAIVGKRSLPAWSLAVDAASVTGIAGDTGLDDVFARQLAVLGRPADIAMGISTDGHCAPVGRGLATARAAGLLTIALTGGDGSDLADGGYDHCLVVGSDDPRVVKEAHVTTYHVLWELVHVFLDQPASPGAAAPVGGVEGLYPFLYGAAPDEAGLLADVARSSAEKVAEVVALRRQVAVATAEPLARCAQQVAAAVAAGGTVFAFGNGGSATDAQELVTTFLAPTGGGRGVPALSLSNDASTLTALSNDVGFEVVFARQLRALGRSGDVAVALSTSGGSANVLAGLDEARAMGMTTVGLAGYGGGKMADRPSLDHLFAVPSASVHRVQEVQTTIYHVLWEATLAALAGRPDQDAGSRSSAPATTA